MSASYKGAPPVCFQCRQSGHIRKDCPMMKQITCSRYLHKGHIARFCKEKEDDIEKEIKRYEQLKKIQNETKKKDQIEIKKINQDKGKETLKMEPKVIENSAKESLNNIEGSKPNDMNIDDKDKILATIVDDHDGLNASKYAPIDKRTTMDIDPKAQAMEIDVKGKKHFKEPLKEKIVSNQADMLRITSAKSKNRNSNIKSLSNYTSPMINPHASLVAARKYDSILSKSDLSNKKESEGKKD
ncbi:hypothetical protein BJ944DRAFT_279544 [Cunninghamella echinulata]|nr:hypothetical protein BJ944DRAFT_279544 [Cunninghamella echinulata]